MSLYSTKSSTLTSDAKLKGNRQMLNLFVFVIGLFCLHWLLGLIRLLHFNQGGTGHAEDSMDVHPHLDFNLGTLARCLWDDFLDEELTCKEENQNSQDGK